MSTRSRTGRLEGVRIKAAGSRAAARARTHRGRALGPDRHVVKDGAGARDGIGARMGDDGALAAVGDPVAGVAEGAGEHGGVCSGALQLRDMAGGEEVVEDQGRDAVDGLGVAGIVAHVAEGGVEGDGAGRLDGQQLVVGRDAEEADVGLVCVDVGSDALRGLFNVRAWGIAADDEQVVVGRAPEAAPDGARDGEAVVVELDPFDARGAGQGLEGVGEVVAGPRLDVGGSKGRASLVERRREGSRGRGHGGEWNAARGRD